MNGQEKKLIDYVAEKLEETQKEMKQDIKDIKEGLASTINKTTKNTNDISWIKGGLGAVITIVLGRIAMFFGWGK